MLLERAGFLVMLDAEIPDAPLLLAPPEQLASPEKEKRREETETENLCRLAPTRVMFFKRFWKKES